MTAALATPDLTPVEARALTDSIRADLTSAVARFRTAIEHGAPAALGYPSAWAWCEAELGDLVRELRLPKTLRLALVEAMDGTPVRDIAAKLGVSVGTVQHDREELGKVLPLRRKRKPSCPAPTGKLWEQAAEHLRRFGETGLTLVELARVMGISEGSASGLLSYVVRKGLAVRTEDRRDGQRVHVHS